MVELESEPDEKIWKKFLRTHWKMLVLFVVATILAIAGTILVFLWFVGDAQVTSLVPATVGLWTIGYLVTFLLHLIFWEVLFIGIPVLITGAALYFLWWKKIPDEERKEYRRRHLFGKRSRRTDGGGAISLLVNIVFIIKVYLDGNWNVPFATWTFDYLVYSYLWALLWILIIFGIPILLGGTWWIRREMKKKP
jgi:drug/metabolite transporter superfamily protein YnfA